MKTYLYRIFLVFGIIQLVWSSHASYMDDFSIRQRGSLLRESLNVNHKEIMLNHDWHPLPVYYHTLQFLSEYSSVGGFLLLFPCLSC